MLQNLIFFSVLTEKETFFATLATTANSEAERFSVPTTTVLN